MKKWLFLILAFPPVSALAQTSALEGLDKIKARFGPQAVAGIVEMTGTKGQPQPEEWWLLSHDPRGPYKLHYYWVDRQRATDEGHNDEVYASSAPDGFIQIDKLRLDSTDAFTKANAEALKARVDFDRIDYKLRCREFTTDPLWTLTLYFRGRYVGRLDMSGTDGTVLRSVWVSHGPQHPRGFSVSDSAFPGGPTIAQIDPRNTNPTPDPPTDPRNTGPGPDLIPEDPARTDRTDLPDGVSPPDPDPQELPKGIAEPGKPGHVRSPYARDAGLVDVQGIESGTKVRCPYTEKVFLVP